MSIWEHEQERVYTLQDWISRLTRRGYDIAHNRCITQRNEPGTGKDFNHNAPFVFTDWVFQSTNPKSKVQTIVVSCYAVNAVNWRIYGHAFGGRKLSTPKRYMGFDIWYPDVDQEEERGYQWLVNTTANEIETY